jgi:MFS family permease
MSATVHPQRDLEFRGGDRSSVAHADRFGQDTGPASDDASAGRVLAGRRRVIVGVNLASFALIFESSALTVALPALAREWRAPIGTIQWVADASLLTSALLLLFAGRLSDEQGTRRVMRLGLIGTAVCAIAASLAPAAGWLITVRLIQGACVALVVPGTLGLLRLFIPEDKDRLRAMTWWSGISIAGSAAGPIAGGLIVDADAWRMIFALPALLSIVAWWCLRQRKGDAPAQSHCASGADRDGRSGQGGRALGRRPLLPIALLKDRAFLASNLASGCVYFAVYGLSFALATSLPQSLSTSSLRTGLYMTPPAVVMLVLASPVARVSAGERGWWFAAIGASICAAGLFALAAVVEQATPLIVVAITALIGAGFALTLGPLDALMMQRPSPENSNAASAFGHVTARVAGFSAIAFGGALTASASIALMGAAIAGLTAVVIGARCWPTRSRPDSRRTLTMREGEGVSIETRGAL